MDDVTSYINAKISTDCSRKRILRSSCSKHNTASSDRVKSLPDHGANGSGDHIFDERREEFFVFKVSVVILHVSLSGGAQLHADKLESFLFKPTNNLSDESSLDGIRL